MAEWVRDLRTNGGTAPAPRRRTTADTPTRWQRAIERAVANGVEPLQIAGTGEWVVTSASKVSTVYRTDGVRCECEAALAGDAVCMHRAAVRFVLGWLPAPAPAAVCATCLGVGHYPEQREEDGRPVAWEVPCGCPAADRWVGALLGDKAAAETAYDAQYHAA